MTMDTQWSAGARNQTLRDIRDSLQELVAATKEKRTLVPLVLFVPNDIRPDQAKDLGRLVREELMKADLMPKPTGEDDPWEGS